MEKSRKFGLSALSDHGGGAYTVSDDESILLDPIAVAESGDVFDDFGTSYDLWISWRTDPVASIYRDDDGIWVSMLSPSLRAPVDRALEPLIHSDLDSAIIDTVNCVVEHDGDRDAHITKMANEVAGELTKKCGMEFEVFAERNLGLDKDAPKFKFYIVFSGDFRKMVGSLRNELPGTIQGLFSKAGFDETFTFSLSPSIEWMVPDVFRKRIHNKTRVIDAGELIDAASTLIEDTNPTQAKLRRGMSTLYYALFHRLASSNADVLVGDPAQNPAEWERVYRALDHGSIRRLQNNQGVIKKFSSDMRGFLERFCELQRARNQADYSPLESVTKYSARWYVVCASRAVELFNQATKSEKLALAVHLLIGERKGSSETPPDMTNWQRDRDEFMASL